MRDALAIGEHRAGAERGVAGADHSASAAAVRDGAPLAVARPYLRVDRNDYSLNPSLAGRWWRCVSAAEVAAVALDTGELGCHHCRSFAGGLTFTDAAHQREFERLRADRHRREPDVELRPLAPYDAPIPA